MMAGGCFFKGPNSKFKGSNPAKINCDSLILSYLQLRYISTGGMSSRFGAKAAVLTTHKGRVVQHLILCRPQDFRVTFTVTGDDVTTSLPSTSEL